MDSCLKGGAGRQTEINWCFGIMVINSHRYMFEI